MATGIRLRGVGRRFGHHTVLRDIDLELDAGQRVALLGPNGAGKTTLLRICGGLLRPTTGSVERDGRPMTDPAARRGLGIIDQDAPVYAELTAREHIAWWARIHDRSVDTDHWLDASRLRRLAEDPGANLSRGQRQRLHIAMALSIEPDLLLMDEPTTGLDDEGRDWLTSLLRDHPAAMLVATHEPDLATAIHAEARHVEGGRLR